jgi:DNA repair protein RAD50
MDKEIPELMGVSTPILNKVIFCHQEESSWPLAEPSAVKAEFDEIFAATR